MIQNFEPDQLAGSAQAKKRASIDGSMGNVDGTMDPIEDLGQCKATAAGEPVEALMQSCKRCARFTAITVNAPDFPSEPVMFTFARMKVTASAARRCTPTNGASHFCTDAYAPKDLRSR